jgi:small-conductance mechanosensitive channel
MGLIHQQLTDWTTREFAGNALWRWSLAVLIAVATFVLLLLLRGYLRRKLAAIAARNPNVPSLFSRLIAKTWATTLFVAALYAGRTVLHLDGPIRDALRAVLVVLVVLQAGFWISELLTYWLAWRLRREPDVARSTAYVMLSLGGKLLVWTLLILVALMNLGIEVTPLLTGLGIGGIAVALAAQNFLGDLFASVAIALDKPFELGDYVAFDDVGGTVEVIGLKTTHLRSPNGEQIVVANADMLKTRLRNYKRMRERRVEFHLGIAYDTPLERLRALPGVLREIVAAQPGVRFDRAHWKAYGESELTFEVSYFVNSPELVAMLDAQQAINLELHRRLARDGVEFAFPTRTVLLHRAPRREPTAV